MPALPHLSTVTLTLFLAAGGALAATVARVEIRGLDAPMTQNVRTSLSLVDAIGKDVSGRRLAYLVREAEAETRSALEPFGYYSPMISVQRTPSGQAVAVTITVTPGDRAAASSAFSVTVSPRSVSVIGRSGSTDSSTVQW